MSSLAVWPYSVYGIVVTVATALAWWAAARVSYRPRTTLITVSATAGLLCIYAAMGTRLAEWAGCCLSSALMTQFLLLWLVAPPLLLFGFRRALPAPLGRARQALRLITHPMLGLGGSVLLNYLIYLGPLHRFAMATILNHSALALVILVVGILFWFPCFEPIDNPFWRHFPATAQVGYLVAASVITKPLGLLLLFADHVVTPDLVSTTVHPFGWSPIIDQQIAGGLLVFICSFVLIAGIAPPIVRLVRDEERRADAFIREHLYDLPQVEEVEKN